MALDRDTDGTITWGDVRSRQEEIAKLALSHLTILPTKPSVRLRCATPSGQSLRWRLRRPSLRRGLRCRAARARVDYRLFFDVDPQHHGIVRIDDVAGTRTAIFTPGDPSQRFARSGLNRGHQLASAIQARRSPHLAGIDHLLFLIALLLPSVLRRQKDGSWQPVPRLRPALTDVLKIVTAFTVAHSITLTLSALEVLRLPSRFVESGIAASVVVAAVNNVWPLLEEDRMDGRVCARPPPWLRLQRDADGLGAPKQNLVLTLFGFNVGVEIGQMCVVAVFLPLAYVVRKTTSYRRAGLYGGSVVIAAVASVWLVERAFAVKIF